MKSRSRWRQLVTLADAGNLEKIVQHGKRADSIVKNMLQHSRDLGRGASRDGLFMSLGSPLVIPGFAGCQRTARPRYSIAAGVKPARFLRC